MRFHAFLGVVALLLSTSAQAQDSAPPAKTVPARKAWATGGAVPSHLPLKFVGRPTTRAITAGDLMTRLYKFADDSMMGRLAGTEYNDKGTDYIEREVRRLGLQPAGEGGTYFQYPIVRRVLDPAASLSVDGKNYEAWKDFAPRDQGTGARLFEGATAVFGGTFGDTASYLAPDQAAGKVVVVRLGNGADGKPDYNVNRAQLSARFASAAAIAVVQLDHAPPGYVDAVYRPASVSAKKSPDTPASPERPTYFYVTDALGAAMLGTGVDSATTGTVGRVVSGNLSYSEQRAPGRNVIAVLPGSDPALRGQFVAVGAHNDHVGFSRQPADHDSVKAFMQVAAPQGADNEVPKPSDADWARIRALRDSLRAAHGARPDSIYNGADDDGSGSVSVLEIAEAFAGAKVRPRRSVLFVWHVGEELGLLGSEYFTDNPTVSRDSIVAQLNIDMIGRGGAGDVTGGTAAGALIHGGPGYVQLIGSRRLSTELGDLIEQVNVDKRLGLKFDYALDANGHPQNIYCRSDHYEYARYGIPVVFFTTGGHADYHQVTDEPQYIDYDRMSHIASLVHDAAVRVGNLDHRVVVDKGKPDPHGNCRQ